MSNDLWETPQYIFDWLNQEFDFNLDVAANQNNKKCNLYYWPACDGLKNPWQDITNMPYRCWMNPPYSNLYPWVKKAYEESLKGCLVVCLLPADISTKWFHEWVIGKAEIRLVQGRISFYGEKKGAPKFGSLIAIYGPKITPKVIGVKRPERCKNAR